MCSFKSYFIEFHSINSSRVMMGNNVVCKVIKISNTNIKLHDVTIRELK